MNKESIDIQELRKELGLAEKQLFVLFVSDIVQGDDVGSYMNKEIEQFAQLYSGSWLDDWKMEYIGNREFLIVMKFCWME
jgi:hypothetical protein